MAEGQFFLLEEGLNFGRQLEDPKIICDERSVSAHTTCNFLLGESKLLSYDPEDVAGDDARVRASGCSLTAGQGLSRT